MSAVIEAILAVIGLVALVSAAWVALDEPPPEPPREPVVDLAAPYWEGLHAAARLQQTAMELEQQMYAEAVRHAEADPASLRTTDYP